MRSRPGRATAFARSQAFARCTPDFRVDPERFVDAGEDVVVIGTARGTTRSGAPAIWRQGYVWTVRDGVAVRFRWFNHPHEALDAVGLDA